MIGKCNSFPNLFQSINFRYFFLVLSMLILLGLINGLALLPVLLSLIGPNSEVIVSIRSFRAHTLMRFLQVTTTDGSDRLPPPTPKRSSRTDRNDNNKALTATVTTKVEMTMSNVNGQQNKTFDRNDSLSTINEDQEEVRVFNVVTVVSEKSL